MPQDNIRNGTYVARYILARPGLTFLALSGYEAVAHQTLDARSASLGARTVLAP